MLNSRPKLAVILLSIMYFEAYFKQIDNNNNIVFRSNNFLKCQKYNNILQILTTGRSSPKVLSRSSHKQKKRKTCLSSSMNWRSLSKLEGVLYARTGCFLDSVHGSSRRSSEGFITIPSLVIKSCKNNK